LQNTPQQFATLLKDDLATWEKIVKDSGARVD
jgi:tripartite-type tricarboxylate transporter receptor subunit TctC